MGTDIVCFSFFFWLRVLDKAEYSALESTLNSSIVLYRIVNYGIIAPPFLITIDKLFRQPCASLNIRLIWCRSRVTDTQQTEHAL